MVKLVIKLVIVKLKTHYNYMISETLTKKLTITFRFENFNQITIFEFSF